MLYQVTIRRLERELVRPRGDGERGSEHAGRAQGARESYCRHISVGPILYSVPGEFFFSLVFLSHVPCETTSTASAPFFPSPVSLTRLRDPRIFSSTIPIFPHERPLQPMRLRHIVESPLINQGLSAPSPRPMKTAEEKILFKNCFFKLGQGRIIDRADTAFWAAFWTMPQTSADVYDLLTPFDLQTVRDQNLPNFLLLVHIVASKVVEFSRHLDSSHHTQLLASLRLLAKLLPFLFELPGFPDSIEPRFFWQKNFDPRDFCKQPFVATLDLAPAVESASHQSVLGADLVLALVKLLTADNFTVSRGTNSWEPGILNNSRYSPPNPIFDSNRTEVLRVLHALNSTAFYGKVQDIVPTGSRFLTFLVSALPQTEVMTLSNNLANITCRSARSRLGDSGLKYENLSLVELRHLCVSYSAQLLVAMTIYVKPSPENLEFMSLLDYNITLFNKVRDYFSDLPSNDMMFLVSHLLGFLKYPLIVADTSAKPQPSPWATEAIMLLWELLQCNKVLKSSVSDRMMAKLVPYLTYHVFAFCDVVQHKNLVKLAAYFLLYISSNEVWVKSLVFPMSESLADSFPPEFRLSGFIHSTRDFLVIQLCQTLTYMFSGYGSPSNLDFTNDLKKFFVPTFLEILYNVIPVVNETIEGTNDPSKRMANVNPMGGLSYQACGSILQVLVKFSSKQAMAESNKNSDFLALILRALCSAATKNPIPSRMLLFSFVQNEKSYDSIWNSIYSLDSDSTTGEQPRLMNVLREDDEENEDSQEMHFVNEPDFNQTHIRSQRESIPSPIKSPDQFSINSFTSTEDFAAPMYQSVNSSIASIAPDEKDNVIVEEEELEDALRPNPPAGMSEKAKEKMAHDIPLSQAWGGNVALNIIITIIIPQIKTKLKDLWAKRDECNYDNFFIVQQIEHSGFESTVIEHKKQLIYDFMPDTPIDVLSFKWNDLSLGWYIVILYWDIYNAQETIKSFVGTNRSLMNSISSSIAVFSKFASSWSSLGAKNLDEASEMAFTTEHVERGLTSQNIWSSTNVKLFKKNGGDNDKFFNAFGLKFNNSAPSNSGSGNDIANSLVRRLSDFRMNSRSSIVSLTGSFHANIDEQPERPRLAKRNSVSSLHSLNTLNRTRSNTPRNSFSIP